MPEELTRLDALQLLNVEETYLGASPLDGILAEARGQVPPLVLSWLLASNRVPCTNIPCTKHPTPQPLYPEA